MTNIINFIKPELLILIAVLYFIGTALKKSAVRDKFIPLILGGIGVALALLWVLATSPLGSLQSIALAIFTAIVQGVLVAGASVYTNQLYLQSKKDTPADREGK